VTASSPGWHEACSLLTRRTAVRKTGATVLKELTP
jgi:hypothetical protein